MRDGHLLGTPGIGLIIDDNLKYVVGLLPKLPVTDLPDSHATRRTLYGTCWDGCWVGEGCQASLNHYLVEDTVVRRGYWWTENKVVWMCDYAPHEGIVVSDGVYGRDRWLWYAE